MTLVTLILLAVFVSLGRWQWHRGETRQLAWAEFERQTSLPAIDAPADLDAAPRYQVIRMRGRFDGAHQFLLDNRFFRGKPGYEVLTPFELADGRRILVNRGWLPFLGHRDRLPDVSIQGDFPGTDVSLDGRLDELPSPGLASGRAPPAADASCAPTSTSGGGPSGAAVARRGGEPVEHADGRVPVHTGVGDRLAVVSSRPAESPGARRRGRTRA